ncbi:MAG: glycosyltransferase family 9 protein [Planctomycetes bacterium]|nr:glycosyltransferase family 9 protein [Planctomycetota bacterium]
MAIPWIRRGARRFLGVLAGIRGVASRLPPARVRRILIVRLDQIGDGILTLPLVAGLRRAFPDARIDWVVRPPLVPLLSPGTDRNVRIVPFDVPWWSGSACGPEAYAATFARFAARIRTARYDIAIAPRPADWRDALCLVLARARWRAGFDCAGLGFAMSAPLREIPAVHIAEENAQALALVGAGGEGLPGIVLAVGDRARRRARSILGDGGVDGPYAVFSPGAGYPSKLWPIDRFAAVGRTLRDERDLSIAVVGSGSERARIGEVAASIGRAAVDLAGRLDVGELAAAIDGATLFIGCDSGPAHIAGALGTPSVVVFSGTNHAWRWRPIGPAVRVIEAYVPCKPCCRKVCPLTRHLCMEAIEAGEVLDAARELVRAARVPEPVGAAGR